MTTCGPAQTGRVAPAVTVLTPGSSCTVAVQFRPLAAPQTTGNKSATLSVADSFGTQSASLTGTAQ